MNKIEALLRVILNDQAYLYALINRLEHPDMATDEQFRQWEDEWKEHTHILVEDLIEDDDDTDTENEPCPSCGSTRWGDCGWCT